MAKSQQNKLKQIEKLGKAYLREYLQEAIFEKDKLTKDWYKALLFYFSKSFYRGRRDEISDVFRERTLNILKVVYKEDKNIDNWNLKELESKLVENGVNNRVDRKMVIDSITFLKNISSHNIVKYSKDEVVNRRSRKVYKDLKSIFGIGDKLACFYLRDIALVYKLEKNIKESEQIFFQPIDTWVLQVARAIHLIDKSDKRTEVVKQKIIDRCLKYGISPILFNAGAWYLGTHSFQLLLDIYSNEG